MNISKFDTLLNIIIKIKDFIFWIFKGKTKFNKAPYYFKNNHKHVTVYDNGNGIVINSFDIVFNTTESDKLYRAMNIEDGKKSSNFSKLKDMKNVILNDRFDKNGFWVYSDDGIIDDIIEEYWDEVNRDDENIKSKNNKQEIRWYFKFNTSKIKLHKPYHVIYIISIPGMFPICNGKIDIEEKPKNFNEYSSSSIQMQTPTENFTYTISFYNTISLKSEPEAIFRQIDSSRSESKQLKKEYNIIYNKYICYIKSPQLGSRIKLKWRFQQ